MHAYSLFIKKNKFIYNQYFKCLIGYPVSATFLIVLSIISFMFYRLFRIDLACSSWSM
jgi:hypothetical protein